MATFSPHPYQDAAIQFALEKPACMLAMEMGLGKTVVTATVLARLLAHCEVRRVLVVGPKRVMTHTWPAELRKWDHLRHLRIAHLTGNEPERVRGLQTHADIWLVNRENLKWLAGGYQRAGIRWPFDCVVIDESTSFKSQASKRWEAMAWARPMVRRIIELTGMPVTNSHMDLWAQLYLLDGGERLFPTITAYRDYAFDQNYNGYGWVLKGGDTAEWIHNRISDIVLPLRAADHIAMPELRVIDIPVPLPGSARVIYNKMLAEFTAEVENGETVTAVNAAVKVGKLAQIANGFTYGEDGQIHDIHSAKLDALEELLEAAGTEPMMVCYTFKADLARLQKRFPHGRSVNEKGAIDAWNRGEIKLLWLHPASAGHGLNLQDGGHHMVWYGLTYSLELYQQTIARLYRQGQKSMIVFIHRLMGEDTIDYGIAEVLSGKGTNLAMLMRALIDRQIATARR